MGATCLPEGVQLNYVLSKQSWLDNVALGHGACYFSHRQKKRGGRGVTERIQHEDDLQCCLSHAKCGQRGVPDTSVLEDGRHRQKTGLFYFPHTSFLYKYITNRKRKWETTALQAFAHTCNYRNPAK